MCQAIRGVRVTPKVRRERVIIGEGFAAAGHPATVLLRARSGKSKAGSETRVAQ